MGKNKKTFEELEGETHVFKYDVTLETTSRHGTIKYPITYEIFLTEKDNKDPLNYAEFIVSRILREGAIIIAPKEVIGIPISEIKQIVVIETPPQIPVESA